METKLATMSADRKESASAERSATTRPDPAPALMGGKLRTEVLAEIEAMALFVLSDGREISEEPAKSLSRLEQREGLTLGELIALHGQLARVVAPAKPRSILSLQQGHSAGRWAGFFGPTPGVRRLTFASLFFACVFVLISLSGEINIEAMSKSISTS